MRKIWLGAICFWWRGPDKFCRHSCIARLCSYTSGARRRKEKKGRKLHSLESAPVAATSVSSLLCCATRKGQRWTECGGRGSPTRVRRQLHALASPSILCFPCAAACICRSSSGDGHRGASERAISQRRRKPDRSQFSLAYGPTF